MEEGIDFKGFTVGTSIVLGNYGQARPLDPTVLSENPRNMHFPGEKIDKALAMEGGLGAYSLRANV